MKNILHFVLNALTIYNTETSEVVDEYDLGYMSRNLSINPEGNTLILSNNNKLMVFNFKDQKLTLVSKILTADLIKGLPNSEYYGSLYPFPPHFLQEIPTRFMWQLVLIRSCMIFKKNQSLAHTFSGNRLYHEHFFI